MAYMDNTGLYRKYGTEKSTANIGGEFKTWTNYREVQLRIDLTTLTQTETILSDTTFLPKGADIFAIETMAITGAATGTAIDVGMIKADRTTEYDYDGLLAAAPTANMNTDGETSVYKQAVTVPTGLTGTGAKIGVPLTETVYISASRTDGTAFTAGDILLTIKYFQKT
jgi:hypothetical protein